MKTNNYASTIVQSACNCDDGALIWTSAILNKSINRHNSATVWPIATKFDTKTDIDVWTMQIADTYRCSGRGNNQKTCRPLLSARGRNDWIDRLMHMSQQLQQTATQQARTHALGEIDVNSIHHTNDVEKGPETDRHTHDMYVEFRCLVDRKIA